MIDGVRVSKCLSKQFCLVERRQSTPRLRSGSQTPAEAETGQESGGTKQGSPCNERRDSAEAWLEVSPGRLLERVELGQVEETELWKIPMQ